MTSDSRIDAYIAKSADFAQPILKHLRGVVHNACPEAEETIKWGMPNFIYRGKILCIMAAFKQHCAFGLWRGTEAIDHVRDDAMGQFGRIVSLRDLPGKKALTGYLKQGMRTIEQAEAAPAPKSKPKAYKPELSIPEDLAAALGKHPKAKQAFENFPPSHRREYIEWIVEAKREETRKRRLTQAIEWLADGKPRNWKYMNC